MLNRREFMQTTTGATAVSLLDFACIEEEPIKFHKKSYLTDNILVVCGPNSKVDCWQDFFELRWDFTVTKGPNRIAMFFVKGPQLHLSDYSWNTRMGEIQKQMSRVANYLREHKELWMMVDSSNKQKMPDGVHSVYPWDYEFTS